MRSFNCSYGSTILLRENVYIKLIWRKYNTSHREVRKFNKMGRITGSTKLPREDVYIKLIWRKYNTSPREIMRFNKIDLITSQREVLTSLAEVQYFS